MSEIPKIIWMVWFQGKNTLPTLTKECISSWEVLNPGWEVRVLDKESLPTYIDADFYLNHPHIPPQALSDIVRMFLLKRYGGVWVDASVFCARPLEGWIYDAAPDGFFAFSKPREDKLISSWFLVGSKNNPIINVWYNAVIVFWTTGPVMHKRFAFYYHKIMALCFRIGLIAIVKKSMHIFKRFGFFPYFWFHYLFDELYDKKPWVKEMWDRVPHISADGPHRLFFHGLTEKPTPEIIEGIRTQEIPVYKLSWRVDLTDKAIKGSAIDLLILETKKQYNYS